MQRGGVLYPPERWGPLPPFISHHPDGFHWVNVLLAAAAAATIAALIGGVLVAIYFGRKATISVGADSHQYLGGVTVAVRPSVTAIGYFKFKLLRSTLTVAEMVRVTVDALATEAMDEPWEVDGVFGNQFAYGGETLATTTVFNVGMPSDTTIGWMVRLGVTRDTRLGRFAGWTTRGLQQDNRFRKWLNRRLVRTWQDRTFVARPEVASGA